MSLARYNIGILGTSSRILIQAGESEQVTIEQLWLCNVGSSNRTIEMAHVPAGDDGAETNFRLFHETTVRAGQTVVVDTRISLMPGDKILASASAASSIVVTAYGRKIP